MTLTLNLSPELESQLRQAADQAGEEVEAFVLRLVRERVEPDYRQEVEDYSEWRKRFDAWLASRKPVGHFVDDSRESIYEDRG